MENMDKGLIVPKWVLIKRPQIPEIPQNLSAQIVCPSPKVLDFNEKRLHCTIGRRGGGSKQKGFRVQARDFGEKRLHWVFIVREPKHA